MSRPVPASAYRIALGILVLLAMPLVTLWTFIMALASLATNTGVKPTSAFAQECFNLLQTLTGLHLYFGAFITAGMLIWLGVDTIRRGIHGPKQLGTLSEGTVWAMVLTVTMPFLLCAPLILQGLESSPANDSAPFALFTWIGVTGAGVAASVVLLVRDLRRNR